MTVAKPRLTGGVPVPSASRNQSPVRSVSLPARTGQAQVIGLDLAAESTGVALADGNTLAIRAPKQAGKRRTLADDLTRMNHIAAQVETILAWGADLAVIEDYAPGIRSAAAHRLAEIGGIVRLACHRAGTRIALVNPTHLKIYATGSAKAEKRDMATAALKRFGLEFPNSDECDAFWLRAMGLDQIGRPLAPMPQTHRAALDKVTWPNPTINGLETSHA